MILQKKLSIIIVLTIMAIAFTPSKSFGQESLDIKISSIKKNTGNVVV